MASKRKSKTKSRDIKNDGDLDIQNMDLDRADEFLLHAKKKKLEDTYKEDDQEDLLFEETECKEIVRTNLKSSKNCLKHKTVNTKHNKKRLKLKSNGVSLENREKRHICKLELRFNKHIGEKIDKAPNNSHNNIAPNTKHEEKNCTTQNLNKRMFRNPNFLKNILDKYELLEPDKNRDNKDVDGTKKKINRGTFRNPNLLQTVLNNKYGRLESERSNSDRLSPNGIERRVSIESESDTEDVEPVNHRRSIGVNRISVSLRQKMLQRLQAAKYRYSHSRELKSSR